MDNHWTQIQEKNQFLIEQEKIRGGDYDTFPSFGNEDDSQLTRLNDTN